ncbi:Xaa-Pro aminopeptidase [Rathayibacter sp. AY1C3]|nr:Xaa-Pro aminopeptidase [Rathayibacter sp. AY1A5]PPG79409.1 Xaa-Pro aminopeptidase [Rathayibacter sp. AY1E5]PPG85314.1 Xaa-Pro aminopeptidase [Rathayibacter sp. AY1H2]PPH17876.1 Xaa-Pro aminopeptidase [Rathayibacter sp. AY1F8]PPH34342.1 Xaa-Pro aminopeptidase [Rathayibacter sp. AY1C3]PPH58100.1 Xaa-Pro aminopeptidase [Rathayibacter sp. AY1D7]PPI32438.1 Xaa-Pro aminopeptidase [Rathayibacter sp. AY1B4]
MGVMTNTEERTAAQTPDPAAAPRPRATANRSTTPASDRFRDFIASGWAEREEPLPAPREQASFAASRRERLSALHTGVRIVVPAGRLKQRANDTDYPFRAHSAFTWLTGWGSDSEPGAVLVLEPAGSGHSATLYFRERAGRDSDEFYANPEIGEFWIGPRPSLAQVASDLGLATRGIAELDAVLDAHDGVPLAVLREADPAVTGRLDAVEADERADRDAALERDIAELRLVKDAYEIAELRAAVDATGRGFEDVLSDLPRIIAHEKGERLIEGVFNGRARADGNAVGYDTIAAAGPHACILHWTRNDGPVRPGQLVLLDAGVEQDSYYTADITRTFPVDGRYTDAQRQVHETVREAADAAFAIVRPGIRFREVHAAAMAVIARRTAEWGLLPVSAEEALEADNQQHRRYMVHGTSHHLGLDVHDCARARREMYLDGLVEEGMVFTIEPGLYFQPDDLTVPEELRGIGVRIEDDVLVTADGAENLSAGIPRSADDIEAWMARLAR